ncbi:hypothetical protein CDCA_CDCA13G3738 [Cyanidium caldarium]|uniref:Uncharacterized protein n=1 Tax=Cyanidium caldarium TaxID=2771 RepID=A0AAV9J051_CYACA|nr:hypothetical protein CDCA_CDCA13G3738 [Cyanidium caldarium]
MERPAGERSERLFPDEVQCALDEACAGLRAELDALLGWVWVWRQVSAARAAEALAVGRDDGEAGASPVADSILSRAVTAVEDAVRLRHAGSTAWEALGTVEARSRFGESLPRLRGMLADLAAFLREWDEEWGQDGERGPRSGLEMYVKKVGEEHGTHCAPYAARRAVLRSTVLPWALTVLRAMAVVDEAWLGGEDSDGEEAAPVLDGRERDALERLLYELAKVLVAVTQAPSTLLAAEAMRELERCGRRRRRSTTMVTTGSGSDLEKDGTGNRIVAAVEVRDAMLELAEHTLHLKRVLAGGCSSDDDATHTALTFFTALLARSLTHQESTTREELLLMLLANAVRAPVLVRVSSTLPALPEAAHSTRWRAVLARDRQFTARIVRALADEGDLDGFRLLHIVAYRSCQQLLGASVGGDEREHHQHVVQLVTEVYAAAWARLASPEALATALEQDAGAHRRHRSGMSLPLGAQWQRERQRRQRQRRCEPARWNGRHGGLVLVKGRRAAVDAVQSTAQLAAERPEPRDDLGALDEDAAVLFYHPTRSGGAVNPKWMASAPSTTEAVDVGGAWETLGAEEEEEAAALVRALAAAWREWTDNARHASDSWMQYVWRRLRRIHDEESEEMGGVQLPTLVQLAALRLEVDFLRRWHRRMICVPESSLWRLPLGPSPYGQIPDASVSMLPPLPPLSSDSLRVLSAEMSVPGDVHALSHQEAALDATLRLLLTHPDWQTRSTAGGEAEGHEGVWSGERSSADGAESIVAAAAAVSSVALLRLVFAQLRALACTAPDGLQRLRRDTQHKPQKWMEAVTRPAREFTARRHSRAHLDALVSVWWLMWLVGESMATTDAPEEGAAQWRRCLVSEPRVARCARLLVHEAVIGSCPPSLIGTGGVARAVDLLRRLWAYVDDGESPSSQARGWRAANFFFWHSMLLWQAAFERQAAARRDGIVNASLLDDVATLGEAVAAAWLATLRACPALAADALAPANVWAHPPLPTFYGQFDHRAEHATPRETLPVGTQRRVLAMRPRANHHDHTRLFY